MKYSPDGLFIASGSFDKTVRIWDINTQKQVGGNLEGHKHNVNTLDYSSDGKYVVSGSVDETIRIWNC